MEIRCSRCCRRIYANEVITYFPCEETPSVQEFICVKCWIGMSVDDKKFEEENNWIPPYEIVL